MTVKINSNKLLLFFYCFFVCTNQYFQFIGIPIFIFPLMGLVGKTILRGFLPKDKNKLIFLFLILWILYAFIYSLIVDNYYSWRYLLFLFLNVCGFYVICCNCKGNEKTIVNGFTMGLAINLIVCIWELITHNHIVPLTTSYIRRFSNNPLGFYPNANDLSCFLVVMISIIIIGYIMKNTSKIFKFFYFVLFCITIYIIYRTKSVIGIFSILFCPVLIYFIRNVKNKIGIIKLLFIFSILFIMCIIASNFINLYILKNNLELMFFERTQLWIKAIDLLFSTYLFGIGPGQNRILNDGLVHNVFIEILSEYGIVFFIGFIIIYYFIIKKLFKEENDFFNNLRLSIIILISVLSISTSSLSKIFPIWSVIAFLYAMDSKNYIFRKRGNRD